MSGLVLPGIGGSGPQHWQTLWESQHPELRRVEQRDWERPDRAEWIARLEDAVREAGPDVVLVAHSLACLQVAHWAAETALAVRGALLVAPPDPEGPEFPAVAVEFGPVPARRLPFPSIVVASSDDPYGAPEHARRCARAWGSRLVEIGPAGHVNTASGHGPWPEGLALLATLGALADRR
jgi:predicted alpha/beta hydrolase family esterase